MVFSGEKIVSDDRNGPLNSAETVITVRLTRTSGLTVSLYELSTGGPDQTVDVTWGDGNSSQYTSASLTSPYESAYGVTNVYHTYSKYGTYRITIGCAVLKIRPVPPETLSSFVTDPSDWTEGTANAIVSVDWLSEKITGILANGFAGAQQLTGTNITRHVGTANLSIGNYAFDRCSKLRTFKNLAPFFTSSGIGSFSSCTSLSTLEGMSHFNPVADYTFSGCKSLTNLVGGWSNSFSGSFGKRMFEKCTKLQSLTGLPAGLSSIGKAAFDGCSSLMSLAALSSTAVTQLPTMCFRACPSISSLTGLSNITSIGDDCFLGSILLSSFSGTSNVLASVGARNFKGSAFSTFSGTSSALTFIGAECFAECKSLTSLSGLPTGLLNIGIGCFRDCFNRNLQTGVETGLSDISALYLTAVTELPNYVFYGDRALTTPTVGANISHIGAYAFARCSGMRSLGQMTGVNGSSVSETSEGVFSEMYQAPYQIEADQPASREYVVYRYSGLIEADGISGLSIPVMPNSMFEGCQLLQKHPALPNDVGRWGNRVFYRCRSLFHLDSIDDDRADIVFDVQVSGFRYNGTMFGERCFSECSWSDLPDGERAPDRTNDIYTAGTRPPTWRPLTYIGGIRRLVDRSCLDTLRSSSLVNPSATEIQNYLVAKMTAAVSDSNPGALKSSIDFIANTVGSTATSDASPQAWADAVESPFQVFIPVCMNIGSGYQNYTDVMIAKATIKISDGELQLAVKFLLFAYAYGGETVKKNIETMTFAGIVGSRQVVIDDPEGTITVSVVSSVSSGTCTVTVTVSSDMVGGPAGTRQSIIKYARRSPASDNAIESIRYDATLCITKAVYMWTISSMSENIVSMFDVQTGTIGYVPVSTFDALVSLIGTVPELAELGAVNAFMSSDPFSDMKVFGDSCFEGSSSVITANSNVGTTSGHYSGIPRFITSLPERCFRKTSAELDDSMSSLFSIGTACFEESNVSSLAKYPVNVFNMPSRCFAGCPVTSLADMPYSVSYFGSYAFKNCENLSVLSYSGQDGMDTDITWLTKNSLYGPDKGYYSGRFTNSRPITRLPKEVFSHTAVSSLTYDHGPFPFHDGSTSEDLLSARNQIFDVIGSRISVANPMPDRSFILRIKSAAGRPEISFKVTLSQTTRMATHDPHGVVIDGGNAVYLADVTAIQKVTPSDNYRQMAYSDPYLCYPNASNHTDLIGSYRVWFFDTYKTTPSGTNQDGLGTDWIVLFVGPYRMKVRFGFSADYSKFDYDIKLRYMEVVSISMLTGCGSSSEPTKISVFPGLTTILEGAFDTCKNLKDLDWIPTTVTSLPKNVFRGIPFTKSAERTFTDSSHEYSKTTDCYVVVPSGVTTIDQDAFAPSVEPVEEGQTEPPCLEVVIVKPGMVTEGLDTCPLNLPEGCEVWKDSSGSLTRIYPRFPDNT